MKKITLSLLQLLFIISSCSSESSDDDKDGQPAAGGKLVQKEYVSDNYNLQYRYNDAQLLTQITDVFHEEEIHDIITFKYDSNKNVTEMRLDSQNSSYESVTTYQYDNQNRIILSERTTNSTNNGTTTVSYTYNGNQVEVLENDRGYESRIDLELTSEGRVSMITEGSGYSRFEYDLNGNLKTIRTYNESGNLTFTHEYTYDTKPNPFFGQLESLYLPRFIEVMEDLSYGENFFYPYQGYLLPYMKNNITGISYSEADPDPDTAWTFSYSYDSQGYPVEVSEIWNGSTVSVFDIVYY